MNGTAKRQSLDELLDFLGDGLSTFEAAHELLLFTVDNRVDLGRARESSSPKRRSNLRKALVGHLRDTHDSRKFSPELLPVVKRLRRDFDDLPDVLVADALALALSDTCGTTFVQQSEDYYLRNDLGGRRGNRHGEAIGRALAPRDPVPISSPLVDMLEDARRTTDPYNLPAGQRGMRLRHLALAPPEVDELEVEFDFSIRDSIQSMVDRKNGLTFALCLPTISLEHEFTYDVNIDGERFFNVRPTSADHAERLLECLAVAHDAKADIVLYPELTTPIAARDRIVEEWAANANPSSMMVLGGAHHIDDTDKRTNTAWLAASVRLLHEDTHTSKRMVLPVHHKTVPFVERKVGEDRKKYQLSEDLTHRPQPRLRIFAGKSSMLLAVTICIDFLDSRVRDVLRDLFVDVVVVPAMTEKTQVFHDLITGLVGETQAYVLFANAVVSKEGVHGLVGHPHGANRVTVIDAAWKARYGDGEAAVDGPGVALIHLARLETESWSRWVALGTRSG